jgi:HK97 family phage major capsid protein
MSTQTVDDHRTSTSRRGQWMAEVKQVRENNRGKYWVQKRQDLVNEAGSILDKAQVEGREMTAGETQWYDSVKADLEFVKGRVAQHEEERDALLAKAGVLPPLPGHEQSGNPYINEQDGKNLRLLQREAYRGRHTAELFGAMLHDSPFSSFDEFLSIVSHNQFDPRMKASAAGMNESVGSQGGFLVPPQYSSRLLDSALEQSVMWGRVRVEPMTSMSKVVGSFANEDNSSGQPRMGSAFSGRTKAAVSPRAKRLCARSN